MCTGGAWNRCQVRFLKFKGECGSSSHQGPPPYINKSKPRFLHCLSPGEDPKHHLSVSFGSLGLLTALLGPGVLEGPTHLCCGFERENAFVMCRCKCARHRVGGPQGYLAVGQDRVGFSKPIFHEVPVRPVRRALPGRSGRLYWPG